MSGDESFSQRDCSTHLVTKAEVAPVKTAVTIPTATVGLIVPVFGWRNESR